MTEHDPDKLRQLLGYIGLVRDHLRMGNWDVILHPDPHDEVDCHASTWNHENHSTLNIALDAEFFDLTPVVVRNTVVHELTHAQHRDLTILWEGVTLNNDDVPQSQAKAWDVDFHIQIERFVSWTTGFIAPTVPLYLPSRKYAARPGCYLKGEQPD